MLPLKKLLKSDELIRFILVGSINTIIGMGIIFLLLYIGVDNYSANFIGYIVGLTIGYFLHKYYTFQNNSKVSISEISKFLITFGISYLTNILILYILLFYMQNYLAQALAMIGYTVVNYILNKFMTFKNIENIQNQN